MDKCPECSYSLPLDAKECPNCGFNFAKKANKQPVTNAQKNYKFRSPMLESSIFMESPKEKSHGMLVFCGYSFWLFSLIFFVMTIKNFMDSYMANMINATLISFVFLFLSLFCLIVPWVINILIGLEKDLNFIKNKHSDDLD